MDPNFSDQQPTSEADAEGGVPNLVAEQGPYDSAAAPDDEVQRLDFGALQVPGVDGMSINLEVDETTQNVVAITVVLGEGGVQLQSFAAPRSGDFWSEVRNDLRTGIAESGGVVDETEGPLGTELRATVAAVDPEGNAAQQHVRFVGIQGPRWLLRGVMLGAAAGGGRDAEVFEDVLRGCIVVRGNQPMAPGDILPMALPPGAVADQQGEGGEPVEQVEQAAEETERPRLNPFERGPEITEVH